MKLSKLFVIPMVSPLLLSSALSSTLPDEINYEPYKRSYDQAASQLDIVSNQLDNAKESLQQAYDSETQTYSNIQNLEDTNTEVQNSITDLSIERDDLIQLSEKLNRDIRDLNRTARRMDRNITNISSELRKEEIKLKPLKDKIKANRSLLKVTKVKIEKINDKIKKQKNAQTVVNRNTIKKKNELKSIRNSLKSQKEQLKNIDTSIKVVSDNIVKLEKEIKPKKAILATEQTNLNSMREELKSLQAELRTIIANTPGGPRAASRTPEFQRVNNLIRNKRVLVQAQAKKVTNLQKAVTNSQKTIDSQKQAKTRLKNVKKQLPTTIAKTKSNLEKKKKEVTDLESKYASIEIEVQTLVSEKTIIKSEQTEIQTKIKKQTLRLDKQSVRANELAKDLSNTRSRLQNVDEKIDRKTRRINRSNRRITELDSVIPNLRRTYRSNNIEIRQMNTSLITIQDQIVSLNSDVTDLTSEELEMTKDKELKYSEYISRYNYYNEKLRDAKEIGSSQTAAAYKVAVTDSEIYLNARANELGKKVGEKLAEAESNFWAAIRSEIKGYNEGYNSGYASDEDAERGEQEGTRSGINAAKEYANTVLKPQFFNEMYSAALKGSLKEFAPIATNVLKENRIEISNKNINLFKNYVLGVEPVTQSEIRESNQIATDLDISISKFEKNLEYAKNQVLSFEQAGNVYAEPQEIPYGRVNCSSVYLKVKDYLDACKAEYLSVYKSKYLNEHRETFNSKYQVKYNEVLETARDEKFNEVYQSDLDRFYPIANEAGLSDGKAEIYQETFANAKTNAYNNELPVATSRAKVVAGQEVKTWISNNAAVTVKGSEITSSTLRGGLTGNVTLSLKNISPVELKSPIKVIIDETRNSSVEQKVIYIKKATANSETQFTDIKFKVDEDTRSTETIKIKGRVIVPGGKYNQQRVENFEVSTKAVLNPLIDADVKYDSTPDIKGFRVKVHSIRVEVSPKVENIPAGYKVELVIAENDKEYFRSIKNDTENTGSLKNGKVSKLRFRYSLRNKSKRKNINMELRYTYKGEVLKVQTLQITPR